MRYTVPMSAALALFAIGCADPTSAPAVFDTGSVLFAKGGPAAGDPTTTWKFPLADAGLSIRSDHQYSDGTASVYANGVCTVVSKIFASTNGEASVETTAPSRNRCGRTFTVSYPDNESETLESYLVMNQLQNTTYSIPIGQSALRRFVFSPDRQGVPSRCGKLIFGPGAAGGAGSDSVVVSRIDASTWQVQSQASPNNRAVCLNTGQVFEMQVSFEIVASKAMP